MPEKIKTGRELVGLLPAAGSAERISPLPCSKEIFPVGFYESDNKSGLRPKAASHYLLDKMQIAGAEKAFIVIRKGKWDIPAYFSGGDCKHMPLAFISIDASSSAPFTIDQAYPFFKNALILFGFPDILWIPNDCFCELISAQQKSNADIVLGLFKADRAQKMDMVELDPDSRIRRIHIKPCETDLLYTWIIAVWTPRFTLFLHTYLAEWMAVDVDKSWRSPNSLRKELYMGDVIQAAIDEGRSVDKVIFHTGKYIDIGTPDDLEKAVRTWSEPMANVNLLSSTNGSIGHD
jgi:glucose-1-phosphate thymidylyltransferase